MARPKYIKTDGDSVIFNYPEHEFVFYVPEEYFDNEKIASVVGSRVLLIGILNYTVLDKNGKNDGLHTFNFPSIFSCSPYDVEKIKDVRLTKDMEKSDYRLLKFRSGDTLIDSINVPQDIANVETFFKMIAVTAKVPTTIPYNKLQEYFIENANLNGFGYGLNMQMFGMLISVMCRSKRDKTKEFRLENDTNMNNYQFMSIKMTPKYVSPYISITSENFDEALMGAIITEDKNVYSPIEKVFMM